MVEAYIVYYLLLIVLFSFGGLNNDIDYNVSVRETTEEKLYWKNSIIPIIFFTLIIGLRYYVGGDYGTYLDSYESLDTQYLQNYEHYEIGYFTLMFVLKSLNLHFSFLFIITTFIQIILIYQFGEKYFKQFKWILFFYFTTLYLFESLNIIRQAISFSILLVSIRYIANKQFFKYLILVVLAASFHKSAFILLPFYLLAYVDKILNVKIQITLFLLIIVFNNYILSFFQSYIIPLSSILNYTEYITNDLNFDKGSSIGIGVFFIALIYLIIFIYSKKVIDYFSSPILVIIYNLFFFGALFFMVVEKSNSIPLSRFFFYFYSFKFVVLGFLTYYLFKGEKSVLNYIIASIIVFMHLVWFAVAISKNAAWCSPFNFIFQYVDVESIRGISV